MTTLLRADEVATILRVPLRRVYELARRGAIPSIRLGPAQVRFDEGKLRAWIDAGGAERDSNNGEKR